MATGEAVASEVALTEFHDEDFVDFVAQDEASSVETERRREEAATRLTRHARGHLVRKSLLRVRPKPKPKSINFN